MKITGIKFVSYQKRANVSGNDKIINCNNNDIVFRFRYIVLILINYE